MVPPAAQPSAGAARYVTTLLELLGDRDPLAEQEKLIADLRQLVTGLKADALRRQEAPGKWSILDVVRHLAHTEVVYSYRYRVTVAHDKPNIPGFDQNLWAGRLSHDGADVDQLLDRLAVLRAWNIGFLRGVAPQDLNREGRHEERGWESLRHQMRLGAAHDMVHKRQIARIRAAIE